MYDDKTLTGRLNRLYTESGLSQDKFAESCGVSGSAMQNYLKGTRDLPAEKIAVVCNNYHVSADWLLGLSDVRKPSADLRGVCEFTGLSEEAISKLTISESNQSISKDLSRMIETRAFDNLITTYKIFLTLVDRLQESDFQDNAQWKELNDHSVVLGSQQAVNHFMQEVLNTMNKVCEENFIDQVNKIINEVPTPFSVQTGRPGEVIIRRGDTVD